MILTVLPFAIEMDGGLNDIDVKIYGVSIHRQCHFVRLGHRNKDEKYSTLSNVHIADVKVQVPLQKPEISNGGRTQVSFCPKADIKKNTKASLYGIIQVLIVALYYIRTMFFLLQSQDYPAIEWKIYHWKILKLFMREEPAGKNILSAGFSKQHYRSNRLSQFSMFGELPAGDLRTACKRY